MNNTVFNIKRFTDRQGGPIILDIASKPHSQTVFTTIVVCRCGKTKSENGFSCDGSHKESIVKSAQLEVPTPTMVLIDKIAELERRIVEVEKKYKCSAICCQPVVCI